MSACRDRYAFVASGAYTLGTLNRVIDDLRGRRAFLARLIASGW